MERGSAGWLALAHRCAKAGAWEWDLRSGRMWWTRECSELFGVPVDGGTSYYTWLLAMHPADRPAFEAQAQRAAAGLAPVDFEFRVHRDGEFRHVWTRGRVLRDDAGVPGVMLGLAFDITAQKNVEIGLRDALRLETEARQRAERADQSKGELLAVVAHELRQPLAPLVVALRVMAQRANRESGHRARAVIERQVQRMTKLVDDLIDVSRIQRRKIQLAWRELDLRIVLQDVLETASAFAAERRHVVTVDVPDIPVPIRGDDVRLQQVLSNLLHNASKFTPPEGQIAVTLRLEDDRAVLRVRDSGQGIPPELLPTVFDLFAQRPGAAALGGLGIGLSVVRGLVEMHGGDVSAESDGIDRGATFVVRLPLRSGAAAPAG